MSDATGHARRDDTQTHDSADPAAIDVLIAQLASGEGSERETARETLVALGQPGVGPLLRVLAEHPRHSLRWEVVKALAEIGDPASASVLVSLLQDRDFDIRWLAAEGLIRVGPAAWPPLLQALIEHPGSIWLREGAHHVLGAAREPDSRALLAPVKQAIEGVEPELTVPLTAQRLLRVLAGSGGS